MRFNAAVLRDRSVTFAVVMVKPDTLKSLHEATREQIGLAPAFPGIPIVLMAQDPSGLPIFHGRKDLVSFMGNIRLDAISWREYRHGR